MESIWMRKICGSFLPELKESLFIFTEKLRGMETKYSKEQFEGFTHRFIVRMKVDSDWCNDTSLTLYSNSDSYQDLEDFINDKKSEKVASFEIIHRASKEQDERTSEFIDEVLNEI